MQIPITPSTATPVIQSPITIDVSNDGDSNPSERAAASNDGDSSPSEGAAASNDGDSSPPSVAKDGEVDNELDNEESNEEESKTRSKKVKTDSRVECLVCHSIVARLDRHITQHADILDKRQQQFIKDFYRTKNVQNRKVIYDCRKCFRRFASLETHKYIAKCDCSDVVKVEKPESRSSLPKEIRAAIKSNVIPSSRDIQIAERFVAYKTDIRQASHPDKKWSQDRGGTVQIMAQMYNITCGLKKPEQLVRGCIELKERRNLKPQTLLNYLATFLLFVDFCYLMGEVDKDKNDLGRMHSAIRDARKAFQPGATEEYRKTANEMGERVPSPALVRERYAQVLEMLQTNLQDNSLSYRDQQVMNFFILQARINTRLDDFLTLCFNLCFNFTSTLCFNLLEVTSANET